MLYVSLNFENGLTVDALVDSGLYVSATGETELDRIKQHDPAKFFKMDDLPNFRTQVRNRQLENFSNSNP